MSDPAVEIGVEVGKWKSPQGQDLAIFGELTSKSLEAVTHLTEYEDEKANRILTAMAFISAFAAVLFAGVFAHYTTEYLQKLKNVAYSRFFLIEAGYVIFAVYAVTLSIGVAFSLYGMKPRFNVPKGWEASGSFPKSFLFFEKINEISPTDWAKAFSTTSADDLAFHYVKNNVLESYLIAGKIPLKLKPLKKASSLYIASTCILVAWLVLTTAGFAAVDLFPNSAVLGINAPSDKKELPSTPSMQAPADRPKSSGDLPSTGNPPKQPPSPNQTPSQPPEKSKKEQVPRVKK